MLTARAECADVARVEPVAAAPDGADVATAHRLVAGASRPLVLAGGSRWDRDACAALARYAEAQALPVACAFRNQDVFDNRHPNYAGDVGVGANPKLAARIRDADLLLVIGERLGEMTTGGYALLDVPAPKQALIHVHPDPDELGRVYQPALAIAATPGQLSRGDERAARARIRPGADGARRCAGRPRGVARAAAGAGSPRHVAGDGVARRQPARRRDRHQRRRQLRGVAAPAVPLPRLSHAARPLLRCDGVRRACRDRRESDLSAAHGRLLERRRLLPDERAGARDRGAVRARRGVRGGRQRHVRDDPDAPGAHVPGARARHRARQSGLRRAGAGLRRARRDRHADRRSSRPPSSARWPPAGRRCCTSSSTRRR